MKRQKREQRKEMVRETCCGKTVPSSLFVLNPAATFLHFHSPQTSRVRTTEDDWKNPTRDPDPHPEPAHHFLGAEDTKSGPVPSGIWSEKACVLHQPPGSRSDHSFSCWHVNFAGCCDFNNIYWHLVTWVLSLSWRCICLLQVCWDVHGAACTPSWVCCREALRRDQDLYSHSRPHTWLSSATRYALSSTWKTQRLVGTWCQ